MKKWENGLTLDYKCTTSLQVLRKEKCKFYILIFYINTKKQQKRKTMYQIINIKNFCVKKGTNVCAYEWHWCETDGNDSNMNLYWENGIFV